MLTKLLKHEFRATARVMGPLFLVILVLALGARSVPLAMTVLHLLFLLSVLAFRFQGTGDQAPQPADADPQPRQKAHLGQYRQLLWVLIGSTLLCIFASDIRQFVTARFLQGIAGSGGIVISRSVATDRFGGRDLARMLALIGAVNGVAPVVAPIIGGTLTDSIGWQGIFCILLMLGCVLLAGCFRLRESLPAERRSAVAWGDIFRSFGTVLRNRRYVAYVLQMGFAQGVLFAYIASSPFIMQGHYGFSAFEFSICFAVNAVAIGSAAAFSIRFRNPERSTRAGCMGMLLFAAAEAVALGLGCGFWVYEGLLFGLLFAMGLTFTSSTALAMGAAREYAGTASAMLGAICFSFGGIVSPLVGIGDTLLSTGAVFIVCALCSWLSLRIAPRHTAFAAA